MEGEKGKEIRMKKEREDRGKGKEIRMWRERRGKR